MRVLKMNDFKIEKLNAIKKLVDEQAFDEGLWFIAEHATEAYLQNALRDLHASVEEFLNE